MIGREKPAIQGDGFLLRPLTAADSAAIFEHINDPESARLTGSATQFTLDQIEAFCRKVEHAEDRLDYGIEVGGRLIGEVVLNEHEPENHAANMRMAIWAPEDRDGGWGSKALALLIGHAFANLPLNRISLHVHAFNPRARHVYEKLGFVHEGTLREALWWDGEPVDTHVMAMLRSDYERRGAGQ